MADRDDKGLPQGGKSNDVRGISITDEMKRSYLDYAMSVIVSRALPDVCDGLKPVHRRILFAMHEAANRHDRPYRKSAKTVGEVMGNYHPHGDSAIYDSLVRMAQNFSLRVPLVDGQGNFGSVDGDPPAAMRYTESRLSRVSTFMLDDLDKDTVDFQDSYDGSMKEPIQLPSKFPNLLVNGAGGIAVGMATNIPPHNLGEVISACIAYYENPNITIEQLCEIVKGPDFPTGALILGRGGILNAYHKGRGSIIMRAKVEVEEIRKDRYALVASAIPYQVNKRVLIERIADLVRDKRIEGIADIWDESNREGMRIVIELKRDAIADVVLNQLWRYSDLQTSFGANILALNGGRPQQMTLRDMVAAFCQFREIVVSRRIKYLLRKSRERAHLLVGLAIAVANIDEVINLIRYASTPNVARDQLLIRNWPAKDMIPMIQLIDDPRHRLGENGTIKLSMEQAQGILDLRLQRLTALGRDEIGDDLHKLASEIKQHLDTLSSRSCIIDKIIEELLAIRDDFATPRLTEIIDAVGDFDDEDLIQREDVVVTVTHRGYIKRVPLITYRSQRRGGKGRSGLTTRDEDFVTQIFIASTHTPVLFFSSRGMCYRMKVWRLPAANPQSIGKALINLLPLEHAEVITTILPLPEDLSSKGGLQLIFATRSGNVRRNSLSDFENINRNGKIAMKLEEKDQIITVEICTPNDDVLLTTSGGQAIRFPVTDVRLFKGRDSTGVRGIRLDSEDSVISMSILRHVEASALERSAYLKQAIAIRRAQSGDVSEYVFEIDLETDEDTGGSEITSERFAELSGKEQFILTLSERGYGKRSSAYEYRVSGRGGKGIAAMITNKRNGCVAAAFPIEEGDQIILVTDAGKLIRCPVHDVRIASRNTQGVR
ncbi:MAG: DNA gyrase subunit A, partial [Hyphomicrobiaceae bacterium]|nr:DNA gyrase subunit A [Hyphomicrobiaceae bacterium]